MRTNWTADEKATAQRLCAAGATSVQIAAELGRPAPSVRRVLGAMPAPIASAEKMAERREKAARLARDLERPKGYAPVPSGCESMGRIRRDTERILIIPDVHVPHEDKRAWSLMMQVARAIRPETIVILGDFADMWSVSSHDKDPRRKDNLESEMKAVALRLDEVDALGAKRKIYCEGNHEERLTRYMTQRAPDVFDYVQYHKIQRIAERGWTWVPYREHIAVGKMFFTHDLGEAGMYAHTRAKATMGGNVVIGHVHSMGVHYAGSAGGSAHVGASVGWLGNADEARYMPAAKRAKWQLGFGIGYMEPKSGNVHLSAIPIVDYKCVVEGSLFGAAARVAA